MTNFKRKRFTLTYDEDDIHIVIKQNSSTPHPASKRPQHSVSKNEPQMTEDEELDDEDCEAALHKVDIKNFAPDQLLPTEAELFPGPSASKTRTKVDTEELLFTRRAIVNQLSSIEQVLRTVLHFKSNKYIPRILDTTCDSQDSIDQSFSRQTRVAGQSFPLAETYNFLELEKSIIDSREMEEEFRDHLRSLKSLLETSERDAFRELFTDHCMFGFSWHGQRTDVQDTFTFKELLHQEWYPDLTEELYRKTMRALIERSRKRHFKQFYRREKMAGATEELNTLAPL